MVYLTCSLFCMLLFNCSLAFGQVQLKHTVQFDLNSFNITSNQEELLETWLLSVEDTASKIEVIGYADYRGPLKNLYMTGPSCHPGGGISGMGTVTANEILLDQGIREEDDDFDF